MVEQNKTALYSLMDELESASSRLGGLDLIGMVKDLDGNDLPDETKRARNRLKLVIKNIEGAIAALDNAS